MPGFPKASCAPSVLLPALALLWMASAPGVAGQRVERYGRWLTPQEAAASPAPPASRAEPAWGVQDTSTLTMGACDAKFRSSALPADTLTCEMAKASGAIAPIAFPVHLPNGALVEAITINYYDTNPGVEPSGGFYRIGATGVSELLLPMEPAATTAGNTSVTFTPATPFEIENDGTSYVILEIVHTTSETEYDAIYNLSVRYRLQVSPDPATATFGDVPVGHVFHRYVEALAASGITAGCGGGNFCVDAPLTRGQMAVFLSKALGLHFPN